jgi:(p)ppGpp synthase/HD superfamily hydrolase
MDIEKVYDLVALRLIVKDVAACYKALGVIHKHFQPFSGKIQDYIAKPKENGYQSIHTTVFLEEGRFSEIQIRTAKMHQEAQFGICAHWAYKEKIRLQKAVPAIDFYPERIFCFTPKGDVIELPKDATSVDFAYAVHSEIGNHCEGAKIAGKIIPLSQALRNGDVIEIITSKKKMPSYDWLKFVKTGFARGHIGRLTGAIINPIFAVPSYVKKKIFGTTKTEKQAVTGASRPTHVFLAGQKDMAITIAKCCTPGPGDAAKAYLTKYRAAVLHKISCANFQKLATTFPEKVIEASW